MKVLIVEPEFSSTTCTTVGIFKSLEYLVSNGVQIEVLANECESSKYISRVHYVKCFSKPWLCKYVSFIISAHWCARKLDLSEYDVIHTTNGQFYKCNLATFHFAEWDWVKTQLSMVRPNSVKGIYEFLASLLSATIDYFQLKRSSVKLLSVSDSSGEVLSYISNSKIDTLPNAINKDLFELNKLRQSCVIRTEMNIASDSIVYCFCANGTHRRKGLWLALEALSYLLDLTEQRFDFLIVGGSEAAIFEIKKVIDRRYPRLSDKVFFTGQLKGNVAEYMNASDALLFPSYFEAFSLVEIEAASIGLPLYLTNHHGAEMILEDGKNGRFIPFEPYKMAKVLAEDINKGFTKLKPSKGKALDNDEYAKRLFEIYKKTAIEYECN